MAAPSFGAGTQGIDGFFHMGCQGIRVRAADGSRLRPFHMDYAGIQVRAADGSISPKEENPSETYSGRARNRRNFPI